MNGGASVLNRHDHSYSIDESTLITLCLFLTRQILIMLEFNFPAVFYPRLGSSELILFLLTLMAHPGVFDHAVGLVEEVRRTPTVG